MQDLVTTGITCDRPRSKGLEAPSAQASGFRLQASGCGQSGVPFGVDEASGSAIWPLEPAAGGAHCATTWSPRGRQDSGIYVVMAAVHVGGVPRGCERSRPFARQTVRRHGATSSAPCDTFDAVADPHDPDSDSEGMVTAE